MNTSPSYWYTILQNNISTHTNSTFIHYNLHLRLTNFWGGFFINGGGGEAIDRQLSSIPPINDDPLCDGNDYRDSNS